MIRLELNVTDNIRNDIDSFLKSFKADFDTSMQIATDNQQFSKIKGKTIFDPTEAAEDGKVLWQT